MGGGRGVEFLRELALRFAEFPYENISKIIKAANSPSLTEAMRLPTEVVVDHIERNFGGTCFSLTFLFERILKSFGFECYKVMADMNSGRNVHCLVVVREGDVRYMVDPGYALYQVIALPPRGIERVTCPHATVEVGVGEERPNQGRTHVAPHDDKVWTEGESGTTEGESGASEGESGTSEGTAYNVWTEDASGRKWRYCFRDEPVRDRDFEGHWLESFTKPTLNNICLTRMTPQGHIYLRKDFFKFTSTTSMEKRKLTGGREELIEKEFGISGEWVEVAQRVLDEKRKQSSEKRNAESI
jgi:arylamine N-acetyltransferase